MESKHLTDKTSTRHKIYNIHMYKSR